jgi:two-component system chemotaxis sensor kinase CheA
MTLDMTQFHQVFFDETVEYLATMESLLHHVDPLDPDPEQLDDLGRAAHSIKGSGGTFGFREMVSLAQEFETLIARVSKGQLRLTAARIRALHEACGVFRALLAGYRGEGAVAQEVVAQAIAGLRGQSVKVSSRSTPTVIGGMDEMGEAAGELQEQTRRAATATNEVMALVEAAGGGLGDVTEAVRAMGEAIELNAALAERAAEHADALRQSFHALVGTIARLALSPPRGRTARPRPLPKVRRAAGRAEDEKTWPEF